MREFETVPDRYYGAVPEPNPRHIIGTCEICGESIYDYNYKEMFTFEGKTYHRNCFADNTTIYEIMDKIDENKNNGYL